MLHRAGATAQFLIFALALFSRPSAAASEGGTQEAVQQAQAADDRSYLPPWMQKREVAGIAAGAPYADATPAAAMPKTQVPGEGQHPHRHRNDFFHSFKFWD